MKKSLKTLFLIAGSFCAINGVAVTKSVNTGPVIDKDSNVRILNAFNQTSQSRDIVSLMFLIGAGAFFTPLWLGRVDRISKKTVIKKEQKPQENLRM